VTPEAIGVGLGAPGFDKPRLARYRAAVAEAERGRALLEAVQTVEAAGHPLRGEELKRTPPGYADLGPQREHLVRCTSLWTVAEEPAGPWLHGAEALGRALERWQEMLPLHLWLIDAFA
jgi:hypothetical protein